MPFDLVLPWSLSNEAVFTIDYTNLHFVQIILEIVWGNLPLEYGTFCGKHSFMHSFTQVICPLVPIRRHDMCTDTHLIRILHLPCL